MTRETKIGLLVGLGFIVVFAVLLSHTGDPAVDNNVPSLVQNPQSNKPLLNGDFHGEIGKPEPAPPPAVEAPRTPGSSPEAEPAPWPVEDRVVSLEDLPDLPAPTALNPSTVPLEIASAEMKRGEVKPENPVSILGMHRTAPALPEPVAPAPTVPHDPPTKSTAPVTPEPVKVAVATNPKTAPSLSPAKEYTVQSKDSLVKIAQKNYKSSDPKVIDLLVKANEGRIKNANSIVEGQTLLIPDLPPEMFERVPTADVHLAGATMSMEDALNAHGRKAPTGPATGTPTASATKTKETPRKENSVRESTTAQLEVKGKPLADESKKKPALLEGPKALVEEPKTAATTEQPKPKTAVTTAKPAEDSSPRLSLSGFVPVRISPNVDNKDAKPDTKPSTAAALKPTKDAGDIKAKKEPAREAAKDKAAPADKGDQLNRWYEIKANDTMGSIARKELGSSQHWQDIKKLNNGLDPQKMKPGDRIKLPRKPVSQSSGNGRASA